MQLPWQGPDNPDDVIQAPTPLRVTYVPTPELQDITQLQTAGEALLEKYRTQIHQFYLACRQDRVTGSIDELRRHLTLGGGEIALMYTSSDGSEIVQAAVKPKGGTTTSSFTDRHLMVLYSGNKIAAISMDQVKNGALGSVLYRATLTNSSWGTDRLKTCQLKLKSDTSFVYSPMAINGDVITKGAYHSIGCVQDANALKATYQGAAEKLDIRQDPIFNGDGTKIYTTGNVYDFDGKTFSDAGAGGIIDDTDNNDEGSPYWFGPYDYCYPYMIDSSGVYYYGLYGGNDDFFQPTGAPGNINPNITRMSLYNYALFYALPDPAWRQLSSDLRDFWSNYYNGIYHMYPRSLVGTYYATQSPGSNDSKYRIGPVSFWVSGFQGTGGSYYASWQLYKQPDSSSTVPWPVITKSAEEDKLVPVYTLYSQQDDWEFNIAAVYSVSDNLYWPLITVTVSFMGFQYYAEVSGTTGGGTQADPMYPPTHNVEWIAPIQWPPGFGTDLTSTYMMIPDAFTYRGVTFAGGGESIDQIALFIQGGSLTSSPGDTGTIYTPYGTYPYSGFNWLIFHKQARYTEYFYWRGMDEHEQTGLDDPSAIFPQIDRIALLDTLPFQPWLHLSNGDVVIQGFAIQGTRHLFADGVDVTSKISALLGVDITDIQTMVMDMPLARIEQFT